MPNWVFSARTTRPALRSAPMDTRTFLGLEPTHNRFRWKLPVTPGICTGWRASCSAGPGSARRSRRWRGRRAARRSGRRRSTCPTPGPARSSTSTSTLAVEGHQMTQARAVCHVADREILTVNAALGDRPFDRAAQFEIMPTDVPPPGGVRRRVRSASTRATARSTPGSTSASPRAARWTSSTARPATARRSLWARIPEVLDGVDGAALAVLGDFVPMGVGQALGIRGGGNSLDNTLRIVAARADRVGAARHPRPRRRARVRPRPGAHVRRGRHAAGDRQPELHRALLATRGRPAATVDGR